MNERYYKLRYNDHDGLLPEDWQLRNYNSVKMDKLYLEKFGEGKGVELSYSSINKKYLVSNIQQFNIPRIFTKKK